MHAEEVTKELDPIPHSTSESSVGEVSKPGPRRWLRRLAILLVLVTLGAFFAAVGYYISIRSRPEYSLALLIEAARSGDKKEMERYLDTSKIVEDFASQVLDEAADLYGRGMPSELLRGLADVSGIVTPAVEGRVSAELPDLLKKEMKSVSNLPFWIVVIGADRYTNVVVEGDRAVVRSTDATDPRSLVMIKSGDVWKVISVRDKVLARELATAFGEEIMTVARDGNLSGLADMFGVKGLGDLLDRLDGFFE